MSKERIERLRSDLVREIEIAAGTTCKLYYRGMLRVTNFVLENDPGNYVEGLFE